MSVEKGFRDISLRKRHQFVFIDVYSANSPHSAINTILSCLKQRFIYFIKFNLTKVDI